MLIDVTVATIDNTIHSYWVILTGSCFVSQDVYRSKLERLGSKYSRGAEVLAENEESQSLISGVSKSEKTGDIWN